jgi:hypothetical protein
MSDHKTAAFPLARTTDLVTESIGSETVVYDGVSKDAHCLAPLAAVVFAAADGATTVADIAAIASQKLDEPVNVADVELALAELEDRDLMVVPPDGGVSRRDMLRRTALVGGAALAAPLVVSLATPGYGQASSLSSLSYVVMIWKNTTNNQYYRMKVGGDGLVVCGWGFATPGTGCTVASPGTENDNCVPGAAVNESAGPGGVTQITISWTDSAYKLVDVRIKCSNDCHVALSGGNQSSPYGPVTGCP